MTSATMVGSAHNLGLTFEAIAASRGAAPALCLPDGHVSYRELDQTANAIARLLVERGVCCGHVVAIVQQKSALGYAAMIACLKLGAAYLHLDQDNPLARLQKILGLAKPVLLLADHDVKPTTNEAALGHGLPIVNLRGRGAQFLNELSKASLSQTAGVTGHALAYVMFTSGSTGMPKGVAINHDSLISFLRWAHARFGISTCSVLTGVNPVHFDNSVFDFYGALFAGATLAPIQDSVVRDPQALVSAVEQARCSHWFSVPSLLIYLMTTRSLSQDCWPDITTISFGGEGYPLPELRKLASVFADRARILNVYGPTECTCICSAHDVTDADLAADTGFAPLGRIADNVDWLVLDDQNQMIPDGSIGELCLIGPNVAAGYLNDPDRTAAAFTMVPIESGVPTIMYRTGDLVHRSEDDGDVLCFVGRKDNQIKHMGHRIELEEVERALAAVPGVSQAVVVYHRPRPQFGELIGFIAGDAVNERDILCALAESLPTYMIPNKIFCMEDLPKNRNGKIDRLKLSDSLRDQ